MFNDNQQYHKNNNNDKSSNDSYRNEIVTSPKTCVTYRGVIAGAASSKSIASNYQTKSLLTNKYRQ